MLCQTAKLDLEALRQQGLNPTDDEVVLLNDLAKKVEFGNKNFDIATMPRVAFIGHNIVFHEPTIGALEWWELYGSKASESELDLMMVYFFMLAHSTSLSVLYKLETADQIIDAVKAWMQTIDATEKELWAGLLWVKYGNEDAAESLNEDDEKKDDYDEQVSIIRTILLEASAATGINPDDLKTQTVSNLDTLIVRANMRAGYDMKPSIAKDYIAYKQALKNIEERAK